MKIIREDSIAVLVDIQEKFVPHINEVEILLQNVNKITEGFNVLGIPIVLTEQNSAKLGHTVNSIQSVLLNYDPIDKLCFSCVQNDTFLTKIKNTGKNQIILAGIETHICVLQTAIDLLELDHQVYVLEDCVSSRTQANKINGLNRIRQHGGVITCIESVLFEICGEAGTDEFRKISAIIK